MGSSPGGAPGPCPHVGPEHLRAQRDGGLGPTLNPEMPSEGEKCRGGGTPPYQNCVRGHLDELGLPWGPHGGTGTAAGGWAVRGAEWGRRGYHGHRSLRTLQRGFACPDSAPHNLWSVAPWLTSVSLSCAPPKLCLSRGAPSLGEARTKTPPSPALSCPPFAATLGARPVTSPQLGGVQRRCAMGDPA